MPYKNRAQKNAYQRKWRAANRRRWIESQGGKCALCPETEYHLLQVDHIDRAQKVDHRVWSWSAVRRTVELAKCQVLCYFHHVEKSIAENRGEVPTWARY